jgi:D-glycero-alpha-D-manno-heptose 1-phosphate guanylyltransferase
LKRTEQDIGNITAAILAGGFGTRLKSVVSDKPKVLAEVLGKPFLAYLLEQISSAGIRKVVFCTGYMAGKIRNCFGDSYGPLHILYSRENEPLGTGGALRLALPCFASDIILAMNGDSYTDTDLSSYMNWFFDKDIEASLLLAKVLDASRYGSVIVEGDGIIKAFAEKGVSSGAGWVNAGIYLMRKSLIASIPAGQPYSLEYELFPSLVEKELYAFCSEGRFIDIGTPESYAVTEDFFSYKRPLRNRVQAR